MSGPGGPGERALLEVVARKRDVAMLRDAAGVLRRRCKRTFALRVIIRVLELQADRLVAKDLP